MSGHLKYKLIFYSKPFLNKTNYFAWIVNEGISELQPSATASAGAQKFTASQR
jgi:hypothetical protein